MASTFNNVKKCKNVTNVKKSAFAPSYWQSCYIEPCAYNEDNKSREIFTLSTIYDAAKLRNQYLCGLYTAVEVATLARGTSFDS